MEPADIVISDWKFLQLTIEDLGPFRQGPETFKFLGIDHGTGDPTGGGPANLYMLLAKNARGKTTALDTMYGLMGLLNSPQVGRFSKFPASGRAQLDIRGAWTIGGRTQTVLLSLWTGGQGPMVTWTEEMLSDAESAEWARLGVNASARGIEIAEDSNKLGELLFDSAKANSGEQPKQLFGESQFLPTLLYFPAERRVVSPHEGGSVTKPDGWGYQAAQIFDSDGPEWGSSVDNLLVWLEWLDDERIEELLKVVNDTLFRDEPGKAILRPHRESLRAFVQTRHGPHPLSALSHGERAILQIVLRVIAHMTSSTVVLIDEMEIHLHSRWMNRLFEALKVLIKRYPAFTIIFTTHSRELLQNFRHNVAEEGLVKGGFLIEDEL